MRIAYATTAILYAPGAHYSTIPLFSKPYSPHITSTFVLPLSLLPYLRHFPYTFPAYLTTYPPKPNKFSSHSRLRIVTKNRPPTHPAPRARPRPKIPTPAKITPYPHVQIFFQIILKVIPGLALPCPSPLTPPSRAPARPCAIIHAHEHASGPTIFAHELHNKTALRYHICVQTTHEQKF